MIGWSVCSCNSIIIMCMLKHTPAILAGWIHLPIVEKKLLYVNNLTWVMSQSLFQDSLRVLVVYYFRIPCLKHLYKTTYITKHNWLHNHRLLQRIRTILQQILPDVLSSLLNASRLGSRFGCCLRTLHNW